MFLCESNLELQGKDQLPGISAIANPNKGTPGDRSQTSGAHMTTQSICCSVQRELSRGSEDHHQETVQKAKSDGDLNRKIQFILATKHIAD
jgi:hypothetical protein